MSTRSGALRPLSRSDPRDRAARMGRGVWDPYVAGQRALLRGDSARKTGSPIVARRAYRRAIEGAVAATLSAVGLGSPRGEFPGPTLRLARCPLVPPGKFSRWIRAVRMYRMETLPMSWLVLDAKRCQAAATTVLDRVLAIFQLLAASPAPTRARHIARALRLPEADVSKVLRHYCARGSCERQRDGYRWVGALLREPSGPARKTRRSR